MVIFEQIQDGWALCLFVLLERKQLSGISGFEDASEQFNYFWQNCLRQRYTVEEEPSELLNCSCPCTQNSSHKAADHGDAE